MQSKPPFKSLKVASKVQQSPGISGSLHPKTLRMVNMLASSPPHKTRPSRDQTSKADLTFPADIEVYVRKPSQKSHNKHQNINLHQESRNYVKPRASFFDLPSIVSHLLRMCAFTGWHNLGKIWALANTTCIQSSSAVQLCVHMVHVFFVFQISDILLTDFDNIVSHVHFEIYTSDKNEGFQCFHFKTGHEWPAVP